MKTKILFLALLITLATSASARFVTLHVNRDPNAGPIIETDSLSVGSNEVAKVVAIWSTGAFFTIIHHGITNAGSGFSAASPVVISGPATFQLGGGGWMTVEITPESFPPGQTLILPAGTVGIVHLESSTNLIQWQDEWVHTFANTNDNRFFRIRADRSSP